MICFSNHPKPYVLQVSYCGSPGAYTEIAALELCPGCDYVSCESWGAAVAVRNEVCKLTRT